mmetsp:Transcript_25151/g.28757  ORF Transcript_25151/g.28757 Transcript_25151/m.28757 type:complete len:220 (-) Transcript_25151:95-754(-)
MSSTVLHYYTGHGRGDVLRLLLTYAGVDYEDKHYTVEEWNNLKKSGKFPYPEMPIFEYEGRVLNQTRAIVQYICSQKEWMPSTPEDVYLDNWYWDTVEELLLTFYEEYILGPTAEIRVEGKEKLLKTKIPITLKLLEKKFMETGDGERDYLVKDGLTPATFNLVSFMIILFYGKFNQAEFNPDLFETHAPNLKNFVEAKKMGEFLSYFGDESKRRNYPL